MSKNLINLEKPKKIRNFVKKKLICGKNVLYVMGLEKSPNRYQIIPLQPARFVKVKKS
jgi:hypothetical protein